jgi:hypothetical protein
MIRVEQIGSRAATAGKVITSDGAGNASWETVSGGGGVEEAPIDGTLYGRKDADWVEVVVGSGGGGHVIQDTGTPLTQRSKLNFVGTIVEVTDDPGNDATVVTFTTTGSGGGIEEAPIDGTLYGRKDAAWEEVTISGGTGVVNIIEIQVFS